MHGLTAFLCDSLANTPALGEITERYVNLYKAVSIEKRKV